MIRFLHTSDWQLGMTRRFLSEEAQARFDAIRTMGCIAKHSENKELRYADICRHRLLYYISNTSQEVDMPKITAEVPENIYKNIAEEVKLGIFSNASEAINSALKKAYAGKSRTFLKWLVKKEGISEADMLKELAALRK